MHQPMSALPPKADTERGANLTYELPNERQGTSAGISTQGTFDVVQMCLLIVNHVRSSKVPPISPC
jgi:hypothetical protein